MIFNSLSGRFLMLTAAFVMLAEVLIFLPSVARFREDYLLLRLERAQIASLALLAAEDVIDADLERELLETAGVFNVVLRRNAMRELVLSSPIPSDIEATFDLRDASPLVLIRDALGVMINPGNGVIRVIGEPVRDAGLLIEVTTETAPLRAAMMEYGLRILALSAVISISTAFLLYLAVRHLMVRPIKRLVGHMTAYAEAPEDTRRIIRPGNGVRELHEAEEALHSMQTQLTGALRQKDRLAQLGSAVAKISHDLRNILTTATLFADRLENSADPAVTRAAPKLVGSLARAVTLCETTLAFGKAEEPPPKLNRIELRALTEDVLENESMAAGEESGLAFANKVVPGFQLRADPEQLYRVIANLVRNARQALMATGRGGTITIDALEDDMAWNIRISDNGPGLPPKAREHLFTAFQGGVRKGGHGLGLAISAELIRGHGGRLELKHTGEDGTTFNICLPRDSDAMETAAE
jgi:signal transduction histidine kinase